ncbi:16402_t:CDS:2 [Acaulospora morrowiae]|uniref:Sensitive to high expression protein 9, mitochondrial n=1 Tax=Acaulospora morrowiae TaxID=94023 RepID=A0A9N8V803_9GLOM|nr:16402_t:CDS:2 [Acaulospora morrowiae]
MFSSVRLSITPLRLCKTDILKGSGKLPSLMRGPYFRTTNKKTLKHLTAIPSKSYSTSTNDKTLGASEQTTHSDSETKKEDIKGPEDPSKKKIYEPISSLLSRPAVISKLNHDGAQFLVQRMRDITGAIKFGGTQHALSVASKALNELTGYSSVEGMKEKVIQQERDFMATRQRLAEAKHAYEEAITRRSTTQREINELLQRKHQWSDDDVVRFTQLYRDEHINEQAENTAKEEFRKCERQVEQEYTDLTRSIMLRYHEEQVWSDKIRSASTYVTIALMMLNVILFIGVQTKRLETLEEKIGQLLQLSTNLFYKNSENNTNTFDVGNSELPMTEEEIKSFMDDFEKPVDSSQRVRKPIKLTRDEFDNIILISALLGASIGLLISVMVTELFSR